MWGCLQISWKLLNPYQLFFSQSVFARTGNDIFFDFYHFLLLERNAHIMCVEQRFISPSFRGWSITKAEGPRSWRTSPAVGVDVHSVSFVVGSETGEATEDTCLLSWGTHSQSTSLPPGIRASRSCTAFWMLLCWGLRSNKCSLRELANHGTAVLKGRRKWFDFFPSHIN